MCERRAWFWFCRETGSVLRKILPGGNAHRNGFIVGHGRTESMIFFPGKANFVTCLREPILVKERLTGNPQCSNI